MKRNKQHSLKTGFTQHYFKRKNSAGFTLIELLVVIAIIGILTSIGMVSLAGAREEANKAKAKRELKEVYNAIIMLEMDTGNWPSTTGGVPKTRHELEIGASGNEIWDLNDTRVGLTGDAVNKFSNWRGPYMGDMLDPWGNSYFLDTDYDIDPTTGVEEWVIVIGSFGPDGGYQNRYDWDDAGASAEDLQAKDNVLYIIYHY